jgi:hypothetical protein
MVSLESLGIPLPKASAVDYAAYVTLGDGTTRGVGWLSCEWRWSQLTLTQLAALQAYEGAVYVETLREDGTYGNYTAIMVLPVKRSPKVDQAFDYAVEFRAMVAM